MASLLSDPLFEISGRGPAPDTNFYYFTVTKSEVIWRKWWITPRRPQMFYRPEELRMPHQDFWDDTRMKSDVRVVFGQRIFEYSKALCQGQYDYLDRLSDSLLLRIINSLELEDVGQLAQTSHRFRKLCGSEEFWEQAVRRCCTTVSDEVASLALEVGWRSVFFTNKLQLQKLISRRRLKTEEQQASDPDTKTEESPDVSSETNQTFGFDEDSHPGIIPSLSLGTNAGADLKTSFCCDVDPEPNSEPEDGSLLVSLWLTNS